MNLLRQALSIVNYGDMARIIVATNAVDVSARELGTMLGVVYGLKGCVSAQRGCGLRASPKVSTANIVCLLQPGMSLVVTRHTAYDAYGRKWSYVAAGGLSGWVPSELITVVESEDATAGH